MAELLGGIASGISIATLAIQIGKSLIKLKCFWNSIEEVPEDVALLIEEIEDLNQLLLESEESYNRAKSLNLALDSISSEKCSIICRKSALRLKNLVDRLVLDVEKKSGFRKKLMCARVVFQKDRVEKYRRQLERDLSKLSLSFSIRTRTLQFKQFELTMAQMSKMASLHLTSSPNAGICPRPGNAMQNAATTESNDCRELRYTHQRISDTQEWLQYFLGRSSFRLGTRKSIPNYFKARQRAIFIARYQAPIWLFNLAIETRIIQKQSACTIQFCVYNIIPEESPIFTLAKDGNLEGLRELLRSKKGSPYDRSSKYGHTALHFAAERGNSVVCQLLLNEGADPNAETDGPQAWTIMKSTVLYSRRDRTAPLLDTIRLLAKFGADFPREYIVMFRGDPEHFRWLRDQYIPEYNSEPLKIRVYTAMHIIGNNCKASLVWLALGSDKLNTDMFEIIDPHGNTLLHYFARRYAMSMTCCTASYADWEALIQLSLKLPINPSAVNNDELTPLFLVLKEGSNTTKTEMILKVWLHNLVRSAINIDYFGKTESFLHSRRTSALREFDASCTPATRCRTHSSVLKSIIGFRYGPLPNDWHIWWAEKLDEFAEEF